jgi:hypothetical protein
MSLIWARDVPTLHLTDLAGETTISLPITTPQSLILESPERYEVPPFISRDLLTFHSTISSL